jgi:hypothetical protein
MWLDWWLTTDWLMSHLHKECDQARFCSAERLRLPTRPSRTVVRSRSIQVRPMAAMGRVCQNDSAISKVHFFVRLWRTFRRAQGRRLRRRDNIHRIRQSSIEVLGLFGDRIEDRNDRNGMKSIYRIW